MRIEQLEYVVELAKQRSFNIASEALHMTQQSLSQSIKTLEKELDVQLFRRTPQGVQITEQGLIFLDFSNEMLEKYYAALTRMHTRQKPVTPTLKGNLIVYSNSIFYFSILPDVVKEFLKKYPHVQLISKEMNTPDIFEHLQSLPISKKEQYLGLVSLPMSDAGILPKFLPAEGYGFQPIHKGKFRLCVSKNSELIKHKQLSIKTILKYPLIQYRVDNSEDTPLRNLLKVYSQTPPNFALITDSLHLWANAIANNAGIGFLHEIAFMPNTPYQEYLDQLITIQTKEYLGSVLGCLVPPYPNEIAEVFLDCLPTSKGLDQALK